MPVLPEIDATAAELTRIFRDLHANPEIGFEEVRTSGIVAEKLREYGFDEVHEKIAGTGVVGILRGKGAGNRRVGLRADMDALPITETSGLDYASQTPDRMHACGHDGHTTMLLGAARYLADSRNFDGTAVFIFQPAEEGLGGARGMIADGLFQRFPVDEVYGMHNQPNGQPNRAMICKGAAMAGASFFDITVKGKGSHAAMPQQSRDALVAASALVGQFQTILGRNMPPLEQAVLSVTQIHAGSAYNVVPETARIAGTIRFFKPEIRDLMQSRMREICQGFELAYPRSSQIRRRDRRGPRRKRGYRPRGRRPCRSRFPSGPGRRRRDCPRASGGDAGARATAPAARRAGHGGRAISRAGGIRAPSLRPGDKAAAPRGRRRGRRSGF